MDGKTRRHNAGRVVATGRALLALSFLLALWLENRAPSQTAGTTLLLLSAYLSWAAALMVVAWRSWWFDYRLAPIAQGVDIFVFLGAVYLTESHFTEFQSPFLALVAFLLIAAMVRWNWRATAITAGVLLVANLLFGLVLYRAGVDLDLFRFFRRVIYIILLSAMLVWLSMSRSAGRVPGMSEPPGIPGERREIVFDRALVSVTALLTARNAIFAFAGSEEPWVEVRQFGEDGLASHRLDPANVADELIDLRRTALFSCSKQRELAETDDDGVLLAKSGQLAGGVCLSLARQFGIDEGIAVPVRCATGAGQIIVWNVDSPSFDDIRLLSAFGEEVGHALDREEMARLARVEVETGVRQAVARDLHDSVAQFLAGTLFRLEALRRWVREGNDPDGEIDSIKNALRREQTQLRLLIERLRRGQEGDRRVEIVEELRALLKEAAMHWDIATDLEHPPHPLPVPVHISHEIRQLVREAIANAARHGKCRKVVVGIAYDEGQLRLSIRDDGIGFSEFSAARKPRSISERVDALRGQFHLCETERGAHLEITLKAGDIA